MVTTISLCLRHYLNDTDDFIQIGSILSLGEGYLSLFLSQNSENLTFGDALFKFRMSTLGAEALPIILLTVDLNSDKLMDECIYAALSLIAHSVGYFWGNKLSKDYDLPGAAGVMVWILPYLAHATTGGLALITDSEDFLKFYPSIYLATDFLLSYVSYKAFSKTSINVGKADIQDFKVTFNPMCFVLKEKNKKFGNMPFLTFSYNF